MILSTPAQQTPDRAPLQDVDESRAHDPRVAAIERERSSVVAAHEMAVEAARPAGDALALRILRSREAVAADLGAAASPEILERAFAFAAACFPSEPRVQAETLSWSLALGADGALLGLKSREGGAGDGALEAILNLAGGPRQEQLQSLGDAFAAAARAASPEGALDGFVDAMARKAAMDAHAQMSRSRSEPARFDSLSQCAAHMEASYAVDGQWADGVSVFAGPIPCPTPQALLDALNAWSEPPPPAD